jgi:hypothetical protein
MHAYCLFLLHVSTEKKDIKQDFLDQVQIHPVKVDVPRGYGHVHVPSFDPRYLDRNLVFEQGVDYDVHMDASIL